jgi:hypothetical protein
MYFDVPQEDDALVKALMRIPVDPSHDCFSVFLRKGCERYLFRYVDGQQAEALRMMGRFASNKDLSLTWHDAAVLSTRVRALVRERDNARSIRNRI